MAFKPNTTVYLCAGTGLDMANTIWWGDYAYTLQDQTWAQWNNVCFQFIKAHSVAQGYWYYTYTDPTRGYVTVGRTPLNDGSIPQGQEGLGNEQKQSQLDDPAIPYAECIRGVDYICFANDGEVDSADFIGDIQYAFVTAIEAVNWSTARVYFTIDAIMTYQKYFHFGRSLIARDMQFQERVALATGRPNVSQLNVEPPDFFHTDKEYVYNKYASTKANEYFNLGKYTVCLVVSDVSLAETDITPNEYYGGLPAFQPSKFTYVGSDETTNLGVGVYYVSKRDCEAFKKLGAYNAMEHILNTYLVPDKMFIESPPQDTEPLHILNLSKVTNSDYQGWSLAIPDDIYDMPIKYPDWGEVGTGTEDGYSPLNLKCHMAPYVYYSVTDYQGGSLTIQPQVINTYNGMIQPTIDAYFRLAIKIVAELSPNAFSAFQVLNLNQSRGSEIDPLLTSWQMPSYSMTPNNSGFASDAIKMVVATRAGNSLFEEGADIAVTANSEQIIWNDVRAMGGQLTGGIINPLMDIVPGFTQNLAAININRQIGEAKIGQAQSLLNENRITQQNYLAKQTLGLPAVVGGAPGGYTPLTIRNARYGLYVVHLKQKLLRFYDRYMSVFGYPQNAYRFPHINIRRRWCYVRCTTVNIVSTQPSQEYDVGGVPFDMRAQIEQRMKSGITFWNVRWGLMGDGDKAGTDITSWEDSRIQAIKNCKFIRNYGYTSDSQEMIDNISYTGGYASDYDENAPIP